MTKQELPTDGFSASDELESFAQETGRSKSDIINESLSLYLWDVRFNSMKKSLTSRAKKVRIVTEEDVFRTLS